MSLTPWTHSHPYLSGAYAPIFSEGVHEDLKVIGELPKDLQGTFVRNSSNPRYSPKGRYHWFDGDGMLHAVRFRHGQVSYRNRWVQTSGLQEEKAAGHALWKGLKEPMRADRPDEPLKNTANTDVKYHAGRLIAMWYRSGMPYAVDPDTLETVGQADYGQAFAKISAHSRPDEHTGELLFFDYSLTAPYMEYGVIGPDRKLKHKTEIPLPGLVDAQGTRGLLVAVGVVDDAGPGLLGERESRVGGSAVDDEQLDVAVVVLRGQRRQGGGKVPGRVEGRQEHGDRRRHGDAP